MIRDSCIVVQVLGGPLGAIVGSWVALIFDFCCLLTGNLVQSCQASSGGYNEADWLHQEIFSKTPADAVKAGLAPAGTTMRNISANPPKKESFEILGFSEAKAKEGDWSGVMVEAGC